MMTSLPTPQGAIGLVGFDGDDTLWKSEDYYRKAEQDYLDILSRYIDVHDTADERLRRDGQRYTANRRALVDAMASADRPVTVVELIDVATGMPQSSAYRNLSVLEDAGVVRRLVTADDTARFELAEDLTGHHHHPHRAHIRWQGDFMFAGFTGF